ncbi:MAG: hypothetical protein K2Q26_14680 [Bdellovibrionales bacterium]|nr:hypothetical protein [Bdellovibrionales bacterium]
MSDDRKVIPLKTKYKKSLVSTTPNDVRAAATATLAFTLFLMVGLNSSLFSGSKEPQTNLRGIASVSKGVETEWRENIEKLNSKEMVVESAKRPSPMDSLSFGLLEGKYSMKVQGGRITQIEFDRNEKHQPKTLQDRIQFIHKFADVFVPGFKVAQKAGIEKVDTGFRETYRVDSAWGETWFDFQLDDQKRLISLEVKK